jgi:hypothetical protein
MDVKVEVVGDTVRVRLAKIQRDGEPSTAVPARPN